MDQRRIKCVTFTKCTLIGCLGAVKIPKADQLLWCPENQKPDKIVEKLRSRYNEGNEGTMRCFSGTIPISAGPREINFSL